MRTSYWLSYLYFFFAPVELLDALWNYGNQTSFLHYQVHHDMLVKKPNWNTSGILCPGFFVWSDLDHAVIQWNYRMKNVRRHSSCTALGSGTFSLNRPFNMSFLLILNRNAQPLTYWMSVSIGRWYLPIDWGIISPDRSTNSMKN